MGRVIELDVLGVRVEMPTNSPIVLLRERDGQRYVPIWIGAPEATAIAYAQQRQTFGAPQPSGPGPQPSQPSALSNASTSRPLATAVFRLRRLSGSGDGVDRDRNGRSRFQSISTHVLGLVGYPKNRSAVR